MTRTRTLTAAAVVLIALGIAGCGGNGGSVASSPSPTVRTPSAAEQRAAEWEEKGYPGHNAGATLVWTWLSSDDAEYPGCDLHVIGMACLFAKVAAPLGCDSVYMEINLINDADTVIDWTNATVSGLRAGQSAILEFNWSADGAKDLDVTEATCR